MCPYRLPKVVPPLEGDYSTWTQKWVKELEADYGLTGYAYFFYFTHFLADESKVLVLLKDGLLIVDVSDGSAVWVADEVTTGTVYAQTQDWSIHRKYFLTVDKSWQGAVLYKDGVKVETFSVTSPDWFTGMGISPSGKFVITLEEDEDHIPDVHVLRFYEGS